MPIGRPADRKQAALLVIDLQEKLLPAINGAEDVVARSLQMIQAGRLLELPVVWTEQYVKGLGRTDERVRDLLAQMAVEPIEKLSFSCCGAEFVRQRLSQINRQQMIVIGIESHVCVQQTVLDLLAMGKDVYVPADAVGSRRSLDYDIALGRMRQAGAVVTTVESLIFELLKEAGTETFKSMLKIVK
jgi:nicotinamidase-related amidase